MEVLIRWSMALGIAFAAVWCGLSMLAVVGWLFDRLDEPERKLTTPLPMTDREPSASAGSFGAMNPLEGDVSQDREGRLTVRRQIRVVQ